MARKSEIEWTDATWNPVTGCTKVGAGCDNCYAERVAERWRGVVGHPYEQGFDLRLWPSRLEHPFQWRKPRMIFVNSMSDLFHKNIDRSFIDRVFDVMERANWHVFQVLTKRSSLMRNYVRARYDGRRVPQHIWLGVSVEDSAHVNRIVHLKAINSEARFISFEPLLGPIWSWTYGALPGRLSEARAVREPEPCSPIGCANSAMSASAIRLSSSSSNGAARDQSPMDGCSTMWNGMGFLGMLCRRLFVSRWLPESP